MIRSSIKFVGILVAFCIIAGIGAYLTLSLIVKSEDTVVVPQLVGKNAIAALELLTNLGLNTKVNSSQYSATIARNHVIYQDPTAGKTIKKGRDVMLVISKGTQTVALPDLSGLTIEQAKVILEQNGLKTGTLSMAYCQTVKPNAVLAQSPPSGRSIDRGRRVDLLLSLGEYPRAYPMPDLKGRYLDEAVVLLENAHLLLDGVDSTFESAKPANIIVDQIPAAGYHVCEKTKIRLTINRKPGQKTDGDAARKTFFRYHLPPGFLRTRVRITATCYGQTYALFDGLMEPDRDIWIMMPRHTDATLFLYLNENLVQSAVFN